MPSILLSRAALLLLMFSGRAVSSEPAAGMRRYWLTARAPPKPPPGAVTLPPSGGAALSPPGARSTPLPDGGQLPPPDGGQLPPPDGGQLPPPDGGQLPPPDDGGQLPPPAGGEPPLPDLGAVSHVTNMHDQVLLFVAPPHRSSCANYVVWLPLGNASGKLQFPTGRCLTASVNVARAVKPADYFPMAECCDSSLDAVQSFVVTEAGHVRLAAPPFWELNFTAGSLLFAEVGNIEASDKCMSSEWSAPSAGDSAVEVRSFQALFAIACLMLLMYIPLSLHHTFAWSAACIKMAREFSVRLCLTLIWASSEDPVRRLVADFRRSRLQMCSRYFTPIGACYLLSCVWRFHQFVQPPQLMMLPTCGAKPITPANAGETMYETEIVPGIALCLGMLVMYFSRRQHILIVADAVHVCMSFVWPYLYFTTSNAVKPGNTPYFLTGSWMLACRVVLALVFGNARLTTVLTIATFSAEHFIVGSSTMHYNADLMTRNFGFCAIIIGLAWFAEFAAWNEASARIEAQSSKDSEAMQSRLLSCLTDAVVHLDEKLNIARYAPKLGAMLLRTSACFGDPASAHGPLPFMSLVHKEDQEMMNSYIASCTSADDDKITTSVHVRLLDSLGSEAFVMIVGSTLPPQDGIGAGCRHIMGISMLSEAASPDRVEDPRSVGLELKPTMLGLAEREREGSAKQQHGSTGGSSRSSASSADDSHLEIRLSFKAIDGHVVAAECSSPKAIEGRYRDIVLLGAQFNQHVWDQGKFVPWFNNTMQQVITGQVPLPHKVHLGPTFFRLGKKRKMLDLTLHFPENAQLPEGMEDYTIVAHIIRNEPAHQHVRHGPRSGPVKHGVVEAKTLKDMVAL